MTDSREHGPHIWRTRACMDCGKRVYTAEVCRDDILDMMKYVEILNHIRAIDNILEGKNDKRS